jgi:hypothetical protein
VCSIDPFCCDVSWDGICASEAQKLCGNAACPGEGNCFEAHDGVGCSDAVCCKKICLQDPFCCETQWDGLCAAAAQEKCGNPVCGVTPNSCAEPHGLPGCNDPVCCKKVCLMDPFCCEVAWDAICVQEAIDKGCAEFPPCKADIDPPGGNGVINVGDLVTLILNWGCLTPPANKCPGDVDNDGDVDVGDLVDLILAWGPCGGPPPPACTACGLGADNIEGEACQDNSFGTNGGCNATPPSFQDTACGETWCGLAWAHDDLIPGTPSRDTDWYRVNVAAGVTLSSNLVSEFQGVNFILTGIDTCTVAVVGLIGCANDCANIQQASFVTTAAGNHGVFVATGNCNGSAIFTGIQCAGGDNDYHLTINTCP